MLICQLTVGKDRNSFLSKLPANHYQYSKNTVRKVTRNKINYLLDISDLVDWHLYFQLKETTHIQLYSQLDKGNVVIDVGTNIGSVLLNKFIDECMVKFSISISILISLYHYNILPTISTIIITYMYYNRPDCKVSCIIFNLYHAIFVHFIGFVGFMCIFYNKNI